MHPNLSAPFALKATVYSMLISSSLALTACNGGDNQEPSTGDDGKASLQAAINNEAALRLTNMTPIKTVVSVWPKHKKPLAISLKLALMH